MSATEWGIEVFQLYSSFSGGINNNGKITTKFQDGIILSGVAVFGDPTAGGGITNSGVISGGGSGVFIDQAYSRFFGGISNSGKIAVARHAIAVTSVNVFDPPNGGAIVNSGTISAGQTGIGVGFVYGSLAGGISNSGKISAGGKGIVVGVAVSGTSASVANFFGGIVNSSTISAQGTGIELRNVLSTFSGGISNSGRIASKSGNGILVGNVAVFSDVSAGGGIVNTGMIAAGSAGIGLFAISTFAGGISNSGSISAASRGIQLGLSTSTSWAVSSFTGDIANAGTIVAATGIALFDSTVAGAIVDSGSIKAVSHGILIDSASEILATKTAVAIAGKIFTGGITNFGVISGSAGIAIKSARPVSIFDAGVIVGTGGTAIQFAGSGNTLTLGAGYTIAGAVDPAGGNVLQLGGTGSDTFDLSSIGPQYKGFTAFNVIGGTWTVSGAGSGTSGWHIDGGTLELAGGAPLTATTVSSGGVLVVESGAVANVTQVKGGGTAVIEPGGSAFATTVSSGGAIEFISGSTASATLNPGAIVEFGPGEVLSNVNVSGGTIFEVLAGGSALGGTIGSRGTLIVGPGGFDSGTTVRKGGAEKVLSGGTALNVSVTGGTPSCRQAA